jgi:hypothetical protein
MPNTSLDQCRAPQPPISLYHNSLPRLGNELDDTASLLDLLLGVLRDETGFDDEWFVDTAFAQLRDERVVHVRV